MLELLRYVTLIKITEETINFRKRLKYINKPKATRNRVAFIVINLLTKFSSNGTIAVIIDYC